MLRDDFVTLLKQRCNRENDTTLDAKILAEMPFIQETSLEGGVILPWFLLSENLSASTTINEERVQVPTDVDGVTGKSFLREYEDGALWYLEATSGKWVELIKDTYDAMVQAYPDGTGTPKYYALDGEYFRLKPVPDAVLSLRIKCYLRAAKLTTNIENVWLKYASDLFMGEVGANIAGRYLRDPELKAEFAAEADRARARIFVFNEARINANWDYSRGGDDN